LKSQRVISKRLAEVDFKFDYEVVDKAFDKIINGG
jgi:NAD dependent epimerase/dehydratase family enzyme